MLESNIEKTLKEKLRILGCLVIKCNVEGMAGMPDRLVLIPGGHSVFVELKREGGKPRPLQQHRISELNRLGFDALYINSIEQVLDFVDAVEKQIMERFHEWGIKNDF